MAVWPHPGKSSKCTLKVCWDWKPTTATLINSIQGEMKRAWSQKRWEWQRPVSESVQGRTSVLIFPDRSTMTHRADRSVSIIPQPGRGQTPLATKTFRSVSPTFSLLTHCGSSPDRRSDLQGICTKIKQCRSHSHSWLLKIYSLRVN